MNELTDPTRTPLGATVLGYPRIGRRREVKRAVERYWADAISAEELQACARAERATGWRTMAAAGMTSLPGSFSLYDHVLDTAVMVGAVPPRFRPLLEEDPLSGYFALARGTAEFAPLEMTKWFDTNYHYLVPEVGADTAFSCSPDKALGELTEAAELGLSVRPVLVGPFSLLWLAKSGSADGSGQPLDRLDELVDTYLEVLARLRDAGAEWVQLDEPAAVTDLTGSQQRDLSRAYARLGAAAARPKLFAATYFGDPGDALASLADTPVEAIGVDLVSGTPLDRLAAVPALQSKVLVAGVVDGRNVWRTDLRQQSSRLATLMGLAGQVSVSTSCSLLHVPYDLRDEDGLDPDLKSWLAFAEEKIGEVAALQRCISEGVFATPSVRTAEGEADGSRASLRRSAAVRERLSHHTPGSSRRPPYAQRQPQQASAVPLPDLPTTTIGSFPQTTELRTARAHLRAGRIDTSTYEARMREEIEHVIRLQEDVGLDVLVHGEPERNDMVQYFAEHLHGYAATTHGWVQSYGSRCVKPPILYGDVERSGPITVRWSTHAQSLTPRPVKAMLTGPVTMLAWSFVRDDQPLGDTARQVALALRDEVADLESAGLRIIQVDEPALRELLPLRAADRADYLEWAVDAFRLATSGVADSTQIHTHLCYSEFGDVLTAIDALDADVTSLEAARSRMELLDGVLSAQWTRGLGPGVYDIHSPRVPTSEDITDLLRRATQALPRHQIWVNPDCGLKTRTYEQVTAALHAMVTAAEALRNDASG
ncbi:MAG TPA: 5-methyltetrahydropteroyltriglutamate--homocysteine S-methyltransferase [Nocardioidaceae bacterium]|nr:5-methyltetrahydropteroyltriglutamate--homocysteine S-methyltransferase [Nocardioidaceae bacterium]